MDEVTALRERGWSLKELIGMDIVSFGSLCQSSARVNAAKEIRAVEDLFVASGNAFGGGKEATRNLAKYLKPRERVARGAEHNDVERAVRAFGKGL